MLLLASCGSARASSSPGESTPLQTTIDPPIVDSQAAFPAKLALTTKNGEIVTYSPDAPFVLTNGVMAPTGTVFVARVDGCWPHRGRMARRTFRCDLEFDSDRWRLPADGGRPGRQARRSDQFGAGFDDGRAGYTVRRRGAPVDVRSVLVPGGVRQRLHTEGAGLPIGVFVIEYLAGTPIGSA